MTKYSILIQTATGDICTGGVEAKDVEEAVVTTLKKGLKVSKPMSGYSVAGDKSWLFTGYIKRSKNMYFSGKVWKVTDKKFKEGFTTNVNRSYK